LYNIVIEYDGTTVSDITFDLFFAYDMLEEIMSSFSVDDDLIAIGCEACGLYDGRVTLYDRSTLEELHKSYGSVNLGNYYYGKDIEIIKKGDFSFIYVISHSKSTDVTRTYYINVIKAVNVDGVFEFFI
jgi:hypothetical protein